VHGHHHEEDGRDHDRDAADPAEDPTAEDLFEVQRRLGRRRRPVPGRRRLGGRLRDDGRRQGYASQLQHAFEGLHSIFEEGEALLDRGFHGLLLGSGS